MEHATLHRVHAVNQKLLALLARINEALAGRTNFSVEDVREIAEPVSEMAPLIRDVHHTRAVLPELQAEFEAYTKNLEELQGGMDRIRCVLLARCAQVEAQRGHLSTASLWAATWRQTQ